MFNFQIGFAGQCPGLSSNFQRGYIVQPQTDGSAEHCPAKVQPHSRKSAEVQPQPGIKKSAG